MPRCGHSIAHGEDFPVARPPQDQRNAQQHGLGHALAADCGRAQRRIPVVVEQRGRRPGRRNLCARDFANHVGEVHTIAEGEARPVGLARTQAPAEADQAGLRFEANQVSPNETPLFGQAKGWGCWGFSYIQQVVHVRRTARRDGCRGYGTALGAPLSKFTSFVLQFVQSYVSNSWT